MYEIRVMQPEDYASAYALWERTRGMGLSEADSRENIEAYLERNKSLSFICIDKNSNVVGTVLSGHDGRRGYIYHLAVDEAYRRKGIGRELTEAALSALMTQGIQKCHIFVFNNNETGKAFWQSAGWQARGDIAIFSMAIDSKSCNGC